MTGQTNLVPKRRFKEFQNTRAWEQRKLEDEVEFYSGLTYSPADVVDNGGTLVLRSSNVKDGEIVNADNVYVSSEVVNSDNVKIGDVIVVVRNGSRSLIGKHTQIKENMNNTVIGAFMTGVRSEQPAFINALLDTSQFDKEIEKNMGATINQITTGAFKKMQFMFPHREEQRKLGEFFIHLDNLITIHKRKLEKTKALRSAYLSEMFPAVGECEPKRRFAGFTQAWEQRKLGEIAEKVSVGIATSSSRYFTDNKGVPFIKNQNIKQNRIDDCDLEFITKDFDQANSTKRVKAGDILTVRTGYPGLSAVVPQHLEGAQTFTTLITRLEKDKALPEFVSTFINSDLGMKRIAEMEAGGAQKNVNSSILKNLSVPIPSLDEQNVISKFFSHIDNTIALHGRKLVKLQNIKKAYLNEMFV